MPNCVARKVPLVVWRAHLPDQVHVTMDSDNVLGGYLATEHLIKGSRRRIAFLGDIQLPEMTMYYEGY